MSDFFTRLAELSLDNANVAQPLLAPLFTQGPEVAPDISHDSLWSQPSSEQTSAPQPPPTLTPKSKQDDSPATAASTSLELRSSETMPAAAAAVRMQPPDRPAQPPIQTLDAQSVDEGRALFPGNVEAEHTLSLVDVSPETSHTHAQSNTETALSHRPNKKTGDRTKSPAVSRTAEEPVVPRSPDESMPQTKRDARSTAPPEADELTPAPSQPGEPGTELASPQVHAPKDKSDTSSSQFPESLRKTKSGRGAQSNLEGSQPEVEAPVLPTKRLQEHRPLSTETISHARESGTPQKGVRDATTDSNSDEASRHAGSTSSEECPAVEIRASGSTPSLSRDGEIPARRHPVEINSGDEYVSGHARDSIDRQTFTVAPTLAAQHPSDERAGERTPHQKLPRGALPETSATTKAGLRDVQPDEKPGLIPHSHSTQPRGELEAKPTSATAVVQDNAHQHDAQPSNVAAPKQPTESLRHEAATAAHHSSIADQPQSGLTAFERDGGLFDAGIKTGTPDARSREAGRLEGGREKEPGVERATVNRSNALSGRQGPQPEGAEGTRSEARVINSVEQRRLDQTEATETDSPPRRVLADEQSPVESERIRAHQIVSGIMPDEGAPRIEDVVKPAAAILSNAPAHSSRLDTPARASLSSLAQAQAVPTHQARKSKQSTRREVEEQAGSSRPVIRVNIGRIEVRATTPRKSPEANHKPARPAPPKLSLEDYLKRRKGGGR